MPRKSIRDRRRAELSKATFEELVLSGIRATTLERVAARAGVSKGVLLHYFKDKSALLEAAMRLVNAQLHDGMIRLLRQAETPLERLSAVIVGNFAEPFFCKEVCHAWISLCAESPYNAKIQRIQNIIYARTHSNLVDMLKAVTPPGQASEIAPHISATIDGVWLRASLRPVSMTMREGVDQVNGAIAKFLNADAALTTHLIAASRKMEGLSSPSLHPTALDALRGTTHGSASVV